MARLRSGSLIAAILHRHQEPRQELPRHVGHQRAHLYLWILASPASTNSNLLEAAAKIGTEARNGCAQIATADDKEFKVESAKAAVANAQVDYLWNLP